MSKDKEKPPKTAEQRREEEIQEARILAILHGGALVNHEKDMDPATRNTAAAFSLLTHPTLGGGFVKKEEDKQKKSPEPPERG